MKGAFQLLTSAAKAGEAQGKSASEANKASGLESPLQGQKNFSPESILKALTNPAKKPEAPSQAASATAKANVG